MSAAVAAAAIAGAFGAPLAGAFYAFDAEYRRLYAGQSDAGRRRRGVRAISSPTPLRCSRSASVSPGRRCPRRDLAIAALLGILAALFGIGIMRGVALCEQLLAKTRLCRRCARRSAVSSWACSL